MHYVTFVLLFVTWTRLDYLFFFNNKKTQKLYFWQLQRLFHTQSEKNKPQAEGSASAPHSQFLSTQGQESVNEWESKVTCVTCLKK